MADGTPSRLVVKARWIVCEERTRTWALTYYSGVVVVVIVVVVVVVGGGVAPPLTNTSTSTYGHCH